MTSVTAPTKIRQFALAKEPGEPFTVRELARFAPRAAIDQALSRMVRAGELERPARGVYARPRVNETLGRKVPASPERVVGAIAAADHAKVQPHGAEAARRLGLSTQTPMTTVYSTTGKSRRLQVGNREVQLRHVAPRFMALAGTPAGEALAALRYLGKDEVTMETIDSVARAIGHEAFEELRSHADAMPAWLSDLVFHEGAAA